MKTLKLACVISKVKPQILFKNLIPLKDKGNVRLMKGEKIVQVEVNVVS